MTVLEKLIYVSSTAFTDTHLILGTHLKLIMNLIIMDLDNCEDPKFKHIKFDEPQEYYSPMFYHELWEVHMRPIIAKYLAENIPHAWFNKFYSSTNLTLQ